MSGRQHLFNDAINEGALRGCHPDAVLVRTVEEATERSASGIGFASGSRRAALGNSSHTAFDRLGKDGDKNRLIFASGFEREDDAALGGGRDGKIEQRVLHRTPPGRIALKRGQSRCRAMNAGGPAEGSFLSPPSLRKGRGLAGPREGNPWARLSWVQNNAAALPVR
jgi:hypothetical protein